jgi:tRNA(Ile)-lysidine synthase
MHKFVRKLLTAWRKLGLPFEGAGFIAAVSGGADSVGLLLALHDLRIRKKLKNRFVVAHFDHRLRGVESERDAQFVRELAEKLQFEFVCGKGEISKKGNLEQNARIARYGFLRETAEALGAYGILTAHTINDQAETFLLNLLRGSGALGLSGMKAVSAGGQVPGSGFQVSSFREEKHSRLSTLDSRLILVRPLLNWAKREDTKDFCRDCEIEFRNDAMNDDLRFSRVRVRKELIPKLQEFNPKIVETLARTADLLREEYIEGEETKSQRPNANDKYLVLKQLKMLSKSMLYKVLREWLKQKRGNLRGLELKHIEAIERLIVSRKSGKIVELPQGETVIKENGKLLFETKKH